MFSLIRVGSGPSVRFVRFFAKKKRPRAKFTRDVGVESQTPVSGKIKKALKSVSQDLGLRRQPPTSL